MKVLTGLCILILLVTGCKDDNNSTNLSKAGGSNIEVELWAFSLVDTTVKMYFADGEDKSFTDENAVSKPVTGSSKIQQIIFELPDTLQAPQLRMDFETASPVTLKRFTVRYGSRSIDAYGTEVFRYFRPDLNTCKVDIETGVITPVSKDGKLSAPSLYPHKAFFLHKMKQLTR
jgi:hypothetical protein